MKVQICKHIQQLQMKPETKTDDWLLKLMFKYIFKGNQDWFCYWGDIEIDGEETEGFKFTYDGRGE